MAFYPFNPGRIPEHETERVIEAIKARDCVTLTMIHNKYHVSDNFFCCPDMCVIPHFKALYNVE